MDAQDPDISDVMRFIFVKPIRTVHSFLEEKKCLDLLSEPLLVVATGEVVTEGKRREELDEAIRLKQNAIALLRKMYSTAEMSEDDISLCLLSIGDNHNFLRANRGPVDEMIAYLQANFDPAQEKGRSLRIAYGIGGSCLHHDHSTQFHFVQQSLTLWRDILHDMFRLWMLSDFDLLDSRNGYRLRNTGQGLNRMQGCPRVGRAMSEIVAEAHRKQGRWVGLSVVHLGDVDVPNAMVFIDKYNQVARILAPIASCIRGIDRLCERPETKAFIDNFGGAEKVKMDILCDYFKHGFDGSGSDGGSCIDGRLTSSWNWCSKIAKKPFYPIFLLTGFIGFDGEF
jgi:hypothetical protein